MPVAALCLASVGALLLVACGADSSTPTRVAAPSIPTLAELSFMPAVETFDPAPNETPGAPPEIGPPSGVPAPPQPVQPEYTATADNLAAFVAAYRAAFSVPELTEDAVAAAGARLCSYLQRHADGSGVVDAGAALTDADMTEPGYPREVWQIAFQVATAHYCGEFSFHPVVGG